MIIYCVIARGTTVLCEGRQQGAQQQAQVQVQQQNVATVAKDVLAKLPRDNRSERKTYAAEGYGFFFFFFF
jgi:hypothetical protein